MKHKFISTQSNEIPTFFNQMNEDYIAYSEGHTALPGTSESALNYITNLPYAYLNIKADGKHPWQTKYKIYRTVTK